MSEDRAINWLVDISYQWPTETEDGLCASIIARLRAADALADAVGYYEIPASPHPTTSAAWEAYNAARAAHREPAK